MGWGDEVALLPALDASSVKITSLEPGIKRRTETGSWKAKVLGSFFHSAFRGCLMVLLWGGIGVMDNFTSNFII